MQRRFSVKHLRTQWQSIQTSLWFVPTVMVIAAGISAFIMVEVDHGIQDDDFSVPDWIFGGSADGARSLLSTIAGSLVTIVGVLFSITIVVLQQAASQFTPRVMGNFIRQTGTQLTLGIYLATFLYALLVLRTVRGEDAQAEEFIPRLAIAMALIMATACLGFLVYFIHHMATSLQASSVLASVNREFRADVGPLYPEQVGKSASDTDRSLESFREEYMPVPTYRVIAENSGYMLSVDDDMLMAWVPETTGVAVLPQIGDFVVRGSPIIEIAGIRDLPDDKRHAIAGCVELGSERSRYQDPLFSIRQLVDIALKALSPGINDPTTANNAISVLGDCIAMLSSKQFPDRVRRLAREDDDDQRGDVHVWTNRPPYAEYVDSAFAEIRRAGLSHVAVTEHLATTIGAVGDSITTRERAEPLHQVLTDILRDLESANFDERDEQRVRDAVDVARRRLLSQGSSGQFGPA
ncbi:MAG: DUF2254 domain-containing protein [Sphaerobacteraceae bacterium]|nr:MAG: DUF2254 domain-containing protein [Sphaerobacteraceae bacterium]